MKYTTQNVLPPLQLIHIIEPILTQHRQNIIVYDCLHPFIGAFCLTAEVAVTNAEALSEGFIKCNLFIQFLDLGNQQREGFIVQTLLILHEASGIESGFDVKEAETAAQGVIDHSKAAVSGIHHADNVQVFRNRECHTVVCQCCLSASVIPFDQHQQFTEDLAHITTVDFVYDEEEILVRLVRSFLAEPIENAVFQLKSVIYRLISHHEILVGIILMELHKFNTALILLSHNGVCQTFCSECFTDAGSTLEDDILLVFQNSYKADIYIINRENVQWLVEESGIPFTFDMIVIDELSSFKNHNTKFALLFEFDGDVKAIRHVLYNCSASRPSIESKTKEDTIEPGTETLSLTADPRSDGLVKSRTGDTTDKATYDGWYQTVYIPDETEG